MEKRVQQSSSCLRIVLYGPESTGKTTLAKALAAHYNTQWVPEFARDFLQEKWDKYQETCNLEDLITIANGQLEAENKALEKAKTFLFCDTNIMVTKVWSETHFDGYCAPELDHLVEATHYDFYFLTNIDVPWEADDLRDRPDQRETMLAYFKKQLEKHKFPFLQLSGSHQERLQQAITVLDDLIQKKSTLKTPN